VFNSDFPCTPAWLIQPYKALLTVHVLVLVRIYRLQFETCYRCPVYRVPDCVSNHDISRCIQAFYAVKLLCPGHLCLSMIQYYSTLHSSIQPRLLFCSRRLMEYKPHIGHASVKGHVLTSCDVEQTAVCAVNTLQLLSASETIIVLLPVMHSR
jgi:hypothetical protein